jgi:hypothetical protein
MALIVTLDQYLNLITSEHNQQPRYMATVALSCQPFLDNENSALSLIGLFDLDSSVGQQLDFTGQWIGQTRYVNIKLDPWFTITDTGVDVGLGFNQGLWWVPFEDPTASIALTDHNYRLLLYAKVAANYWDGTVPGALTAWNTLFAPSGYQMLLQDNFGAQAPNTNGNMHVLMALLGPPLDAVTTALFTGGYLSLKSAGVGMGYMTQVQPGQGWQSGVGLPLFGFDCGPSAPPGWVEGDPPIATFPPTAVGGFDIGAWGQLYGVALPIPPPPLPSGDAPSDWTVYGRYNAAWLQAVDTTADLTPGQANPGAQMTGTLILAFPVPYIPVGSDAPSDGYSYGRQSSTWQRVVPVTTAQLSGPLTIAQSH